MKFIDDFNILYKNQYGFRKAHTTYMALIVMMDKLSQAIENMDHVIGVFLDFSKAFDTVNHEILLEKLYHYGV